MPWYRQGTVSITAGQTTVVGVGTDFPANSRVGDAFIGPDGKVYELSNIASQTVISILPAYQGATVTGGRYGLAPMQGYVKESADRLRQLVDQFGSTMALFGGAADIATLRVNVGAAGRGVNGDITSLTGLTTALSIAQGGTGGKTAAEARTGLGLKSAAAADIVGTVSQASGVPTGAIIERGSNANGEYTKYADGTLECFITGSNSQSIATNTGVEISVTFPAPFIGIPTPTGNAGLSTSGTTGLAARITVGFPFTVSGASSMRVHIFNATGITIGGFSYFLQIKGRWF